MTIKILILLLLFRSRKGFGLNNINDCFLDSFGSNLELINTTECNEIGEICHNMDACQCNGLIIRITTPITASEASKTTQTASEATRAETTTRTTETTICLKLRNLNESCFVSNQCNGNSKCYDVNGSELKFYYNSTHHQVQQQQQQHKPHNITFSFSNSSFELTNLNLPHIHNKQFGKCLCDSKKQLQINLNSSLSYSYCESLKTIGDKCNRNQECIQPNSICNSTLNHCQCKNGFTYSNSIGHCVEGKYLGQTCHSREECQFSEENSWCINGTCLCGAGYTPERTQNYSGPAQCVLETLLVEKADPPITTINKRNKNDYESDIFTPILVIGFIGAFILAILIARRNRNSIIYMITPQRNDNDNEEDRLSYCDTLNDSSVVMIPINNRFNTMTMTMTNNNHHHLDNLQEDLEESDNLKLNP